MAGQYGNVRKTIQNLKIVQLLESEDLILVEGSVPGSKNGFVILRDAIKSKTPDKAPFPAGLRAGNVSNNDDALSPPQAEDLILVEGSVPGSKNGFVILRDAIKLKTPDKAPFPAGLSAGNISNNDDAFSAPQGEVVTSSEKQGAEVEN